MGDRVKMVKRIKELRRPNFTPVFEEKPKKQPEIR